MNKNTFHNCINNTNHIYIRIFVTSSYTLYLNRALQVLTPADVYTKYVTILFVGGKKKNVEEVIYNIIQTGKILYLFV